MKGGCSIYFSSILQIWYFEAQISGSISRSPLDFDILRVDCTLSLNKFIVLPDDDSESF